MNKLEVLDFLKSNKKKVLIGGAASLLILGTGVAFYMSTNNSNSTEKVEDKVEVDKDFLRYISGLRDWKVKLGEDDTNYLTGVSWNEKYISSIKFDDSKVDYDKEGTYSLVYTIKLKDSGTEKVTKKVTVQKDVEEDENSEGTNSENKDTSSESNKSTTDKTSSKDDSSSNKDTSKNTSTSDKDKDDSSSSSSSGSSGGSSSSHTHNWVEQFKTVHHDAVYEDRYVVDQAAYDEQVPKYETVEVMICNKCGTTMRSASELNAHIGYHAGLGETISWREDWVQELVGYDIIHHDEVGHTERVLVKAAWDEKVSNGYKCSGCGKTK